MKISRKKFFKSLMAIISIPFLYVLNSEVSRKIEYENRKQKIYVPDDLGNGTFFFDSVIVVKKNSRITAYSSKCTHLGCRINKIENDKLVCPCHGSIFALNGNVIKGPANKPLEKLELISDSKTGKLFVYG